MDAVVLKREKSLFPVSGYRQKDEIPVRPGLITLCPLFSVTESEAEALDSDSSTLRTSTQPGICLL